MFTYFSSYITYHFIILTYFNAVTGVTHSLM